MAFLELRFPTDVTYGAVGGSGWSTLMLDTDGGWKLLQPQWQESRGRWVVSHKYKDSAAWGALIALHRITFGKLYGFRFQDWSDYTVTMADYGSGIDFGGFTGVQGQLYKGYPIVDTVTGVEQIGLRPIVKPQPNTVQVYLDNVLMDPQPSVNYVTGVVDTPPPEEGHSYFWTGSFDVPVRFDTDIPSFSYDFYGAEGGAVSWNAVELVELKRQDIFS